MNHIDMRRIAEIAETYGVRVALTPLGFLIISGNARRQVEHVLAYDILWQAIDPVGIFEQAASSAKRHLIEVTR